MHVYGLDHRKNITVANILIDRRDNDVCGVIFQPDQRGLEPSDQIVKMRSSVRRPIS